MDAKVSLKRRIKIGDPVTLRVRVSEKDVHYAGGLVNGAWVLGLFGDVGTELSIRHDGDEGLLAAYNSVQLLGPIHAGDFVEVTGWISKVGNTSRIMDFEARRVIQMCNDPNQPSAGDVLDEPVVVAKAQMVGVIPKNCQRYE